MTRFRKLFSRFRRPSLPFTQPRTELEPARTEPVAERSPMEVWLTRLAADVAEGRRRDEIAAVDFWQRIDELTRGGHHRMATQWLEKFIASEPPAAALLTLRLRLIELYEDRGDMEPVVAHLEELARDDEQALAAHSRLAEHYRRRGLEAEALRHYEAILARDVNFPNVRVRVEALRKQRGRARPAAMGETMAGLVGVSPVGARYTLVRELGRGATAAVYLARDRELERDVAVKLLHPHLAAQSRQASCARFFTEARVAASLRHPNILGILDLDEDARRIVMELAAGGTLREVLRDHGPRTPRRALERHAQLLSALRAAHARGIVHRDVKPANLMFRRDANTPGTEVVLGDFGVAHLPELNESPEHAVGTLAYMAPEQRGNRPASPLWDVYAAAVVLYEMLTCELPWTRSQVLSGVRSPTDFNLPSQVLDACPDRLAAALTAHLSAIGHPDANQRLDSEKAYREAQALRDLAIATLAA